MNLFFTNSVRQLLLLFFVSSLIGDHLEVYLPTRTTVKQLYISHVHINPDERDWRYFDELRKLLEFDFNSGGCVEVAPVQLDLEETLDWPSLCSQFKIDRWKREPFSLVLAIEASQMQLALTVIDIENETFKRYPEISLSGQIEKDRKKIHELSDLLHQDLFRFDGIAAQRILYTQRIQNPESGGLAFLSEVWICDADGANARQLTTKNGYCLSPGFISSKGDDFEFFYVFNDEGQSKIYSASSSNPAGRPLVFLRGNQALPAMSNARHLIAFITDVAGRPDLFIQPLNSKRQMLGRARQVYSSPRATQASPTFSPDGKQIAFVSDKDGSPRIYLLDVPNIKDTIRPRPQLLTTKNRENTSPCWSPDGKKLAYAAKTNGVRQIWVYDFETKEERQLTVGAEMKENPSWAPNSFHLVYNTESEESCELYLINLAQSEPILISKGSGQKRFACWEMRYDHAVR